MIVEVYESEKEGSITVIPKGMKPLILEDDAILLREIEGQDWNDCMRQHHEIMGFEPYIPMEDI